MRTRISALFVIMLVIGFTAGCQQMPTAVPVVQDNGGWEYNDVPVGNAPKNVDLNLKVRGVSEKDLGDTSVVTVIANFWRSPDGQVTLSQSREFQEEESIVVQTLNGRSYFAGACVNGTPQMGLAINSDTLRHVIQIEENYGMGATFQVLPDDSSSTGWRLVQGPSTLSELTTIHYWVNDPAPPDYEVMTYVGTQTCWNDRFGEMTYSEEFGKWEAWVPAIKGQAVKIAFFAGGLPLRTKFVFAQTPQMTASVRLSCSEVVANPTTYWPNTPWFTERNQLRGQRLYRLPMDANGIITQGCPMPTFNTKIWVTVPGLPSNSIIMCQTNLANGGNPFRIPRSGASFRTGNLLVQTGDFNITVWNASPGMGNQLITKQVRFDDQVLHHLQVIDGGAVALVGAIFGNPTTVVQDEDNLDVDMGGKSAQDLEAAWQSYLLTVPGQALLAAPQVELPFVE